MPSIGFDLRVCSPGVKCYDCYTVTRFQVLREDRTPIKYALEVTAFFAPSIPAGVPNASGISTLTNRSGCAKFDTLVFWGVRGRTYNMSFTALGAIANLTAPVEITLCEADQWVQSYSWCATCPEGAECNGTEVISAQV